MKKTYFAAACIIVLFVWTVSAGAQELAPLPGFCKTSEGVEGYYSKHPEALAEQKANESFTAQYAKKPAAPHTATTCYVIPVVFHVYGTTQGGKPVNQTIIQGALNGVNDDFKGLNADFNNVHNQFLAARGTMPDITFALAQLDPNGNPTTGIVYHPVAAGYGNYIGYDSIIASQAWDNYKYMNVYVMNDLYNDGVTNNSGIAWYPNTAMSNYGVARVVYNGAYLGVNCNSWQPEFASTLTHEFAHWLNLIHTFDGGCVSPNDYVNDTPPCDYFQQGYACHTTSTVNAPLNCTGVLINTENYMDYAGAAGCYRMFTQGQTTRIYAALQLPSRQPLWQQSNLVATGLGNLCSGLGIANANELSFAVNAWPNPFEENITLEISQQKSADLQLEITDVLGRSVYRSVIRKEAGISTTTIDFQNPDAGVYMLHITSGGYSKTIKLVKK